MKEIEIKEATMDECLDILSEPRLLATLPIDGITYLYKYLQDHKYPYHKVRYKQYSMLFFFFEKYPDTQPDVYELHIACPKDSIIASRVLSLATIDWIFREGVVGAKAIITSCPEGKIANMCRKLGAQQIKKIRDEVYFMIVSSQVQA